MRTCPDGRTAEHGAARLSWLVALAGILFVAAAGNSSTNIDTSPHYPSTNPIANIVAVAATDHNDAKASFSNTNADVEIAAPGVE